MPTAADSATVDYLDANVAALTKNTNLFLGPPSPSASADVPSEAVFVWPGIGLTPNDYLQGGTHSPQHRQPVNIIRVRGDKRDWAGGLTLADTVRDALHDADFTGALSNFHKSRIREDRASYLGEDSEGHHLFGMNQELGIEE